MPSQTERFASGGEYFDIVRGFAVYECPDTPPGEIWIYTQGGKCVFKLDGPPTEKLYNETINRFCRENPDAVIDFVAI